MAAKKNLPQGIYVNHEYPIHIKRTQGKLRPIFKLAKSKVEYKDKCRMEEDKLIINGVSYTLDDIEKTTARFGSV